MEGMRAERREIGLEDVAQALEEPDHDDGTTAIRRIGHRNIIVRYSEDEEKLVVRGVSATRS